MNVFISSLTAATLLTTTSGTFLNSNSVERPISEYCAMVTQGYELVDIESQAITDEKTLPVPFHTQPIANYKLVPRNNLPEVCESYLASN